MIGTYMNPHGKYKFNMDVHILVQAAEENLRPTLAEGCPKIFADLVLKCWDAKPGARPTVDMILTELEAITQDYQNNPAKWENKRKKPFPLVIAK